MLQPGIRRAEMNGYDLFRAKLSSQGPVPFSSFDRIPSPKVSHYGDLPETSTINEISWSRWCNWRWGSKSSTNFYAQGAGLADAPMA
jgi:hypothetical protein